MIDNFPHHPCSLKVGNPYHGLIRHTAAPSGAHRLPLRNGEMLCDSPPTSAKVLIALPGLPEPSLTNQELLAGMEWQKDAVATEMLSFPYPVDVAGVTQIKWTTPIFTSDGYGRDVGSVWRCPSTGQPWVIRMVLPWHGSLGFNQYAAPIFFASYLSVNCVIDAAPLRNGIVYPGEAVNIHNSYEGFFVDTAIEGVTYVTGITLNFCCSHDGGTWFISFNKTLNSSFGGTPDSREQEPYRGGIQITFKDVNGVPDVDAVSDHIIKCNSFPYIPPYPALQIPYYAADGGRYSPEFSLSYTNDGGTWGNNQTATGTLTMNGNQLTVQVSTIDVGPGQPGVWHTAVMLVSGYYGCLPDAYLGAGVFSEAYVSEVIGARGVYEIIIVVKDGTTSHHTKSLSVISHAGVFERQSVDYPQVTPTKVAKNPHTDEVVFGQYPLAYI